MPRYMKRLTYCCFLLYSFILIIVTSRWRNAVEQTYVCMQGDNGQATRNTSADEFIKSLQNEIGILRSQLRLLKPEKANGEGTEERPNKQEDLENYIQKRINKAEITSGKYFHNEFELNPFTRFTSRRIYLVNPGLGRRVVEKPFGPKKKELKEVIEYAVSYLNHNKLPRTKSYSTEYFLEGILRTEPLYGTHYELYFKDIQALQSKQYKKVVITRAFSPLRVILQEPIVTSKNLINLILPLSGRIERFQLFIDWFVKICIRQDKHVYLTVVYFGTDGLSNVKDTLTALQDEYSFSNLTVLTIDEPFSRGRAFQAAVHNWTKGDVLMFFCDVDIVYSVNFLERCRLNAEPGKKVYYPIVFSLYNPKVVYQLNDLPVPSEKDQLVLSRETGFWRDFGYGMTCQYRSDFLRIGGFDQHVTGWGKEDVLLYRKYVRSNIMIIRATDPGIFHVWHEKQCEKELPADQYKSCIKSKALNEASHAQLGMLAFKDEIAAREKAEVSLVNDSV